MRTSDRRSRNGRDRGEKPEKKSTFAYGLALTSACIVFALITLGAFGAAGGVVTDFLLGVFGYVFYAYIVIGICYGVILMLGKKPTVSRGIRLLYALALAAVIVMIHMFSSRAYAAGSYGEYLGSCYSGADTAAGWIGGLLLYFPTRIYVASEIICGLLLIGLIALLIVSQLDREIVFRARRPRSAKASSEEISSGTFVEEEQPDEEREMYNATVDGHRLSNKIGRTFVNRPTDYTPLERMEELPDDEMPERPEEGSEISDEVVDEALQVYQKKRRQALDALYTSRTVKKSDDDDMTPEERARSSWDKLYGKKDEKPDNVSGTATDPAVANEEIYRHYSNNERRRIMEENSRRLREQSERGFSSDTSEDDLLRDLDDIFSRVGSESGASGSDVVSDDISEAQTDTNAADPVDGSTVGKDEAEDLTSRNPEPLESFEDFLNKRSEEKRTEGSDPVREVKPVERKPVETKPVLPPVTPKPTPAPAVKPTVPTPAVPVPEKQPEVKPAKPVKRRPYIAPSVACLKDYNENIDGGLDFREKIESVETCLANFNIDAKVVNVVKGPTFSRLELEVPPGISVNKIPAHYNDLAMSLAVESLRIEAPIPKKKFCGIEIPNEHRGTVGLKALINSPEFNNTKKSGLYFALGKDIDGNCYVSDLTDFPHALVAGASGSGKSVCLNCMIVSLLYKYSPEDMRLILIDPKVVEFSVYKDLPHLLAPEILSDTNKMINALKWSIDEMERRYELLMTARVSNINQYNELAAKDKSVPKLPYIVIIVDEVADIMQSKSAKEFESLVKRLTAKARAAGIHMILATQRPSVDIITGTIKANLPTRVAFAVTSQVDSKTILDGAGADKLLGKGDMLYKLASKPHPVRVQSAFVDIAEVNAVVEEVVANNDRIYDEEIMKAFDYKEPEPEEHLAAASGGSPRSNSIESDPVFADAVREAIESGGISISMLQRRLSLGFPKAAKILDTMEKLGYISKQTPGNKQREVYITMEQFLEKYPENGSDGETDV